VRNPDELVVSPADDEAEAEAEADAVATADSTAADDALTAAGVAARRNRYQVPYAPRPRTPIAATAMMSRTDRAATEG
jgi:hypothetical protein